MWLALHCWNHAVLAATVAACLRASDRSPSGSLSSCSYGPCQHGVDILVFMDGVAAEAVLGAAAQSLMVAAGTTAGGAATGSGEGAGATCQLEEKALKQHRVQVHLQLSTPQLLRMAGHAVQDGAAVTSPRAGPPAPFKLMSTQTSRSPTVHP